MVNSEYALKRSLNQCYNKFESPACIEQIVYYCINVCICIYALVQLGRRAWYDRLNRIPKIKLMILLCLFIGAAFDLVYEANFTQHWSYYTSVFFDDLSFMWIVYYFGKKGLNAMGYGSILKYYKIGLVVLVLLFLCYYTYNLINDSISQIHYVCFNLWYTYSRVIVLVLELALCVIGVCIHQKLKDKLGEASVFMREETVTNLINKSQKDMRKLIILIGIFFISDVVLLTEAVIFQINRNLNCEFFPQDPTANLFANITIVLFGAYAPRICSILVFRFNKIYDKSRRSRVETEHIEIQLAIRRDPSRSPSLMEQSLIASNLK